MFRLLYLLSVAVLMVSVMPISAQNTVEITCPDGTSIHNSVKISINMRRGFTYTATALGIDDFDPAIAILNEDKIIGCNDDSRDAARYEANLPTTGELSGSTTSAQIPFSHDGDRFATLSIVVGDVNGANGEFLLILEGMAVTEADGKGDPFAVQLTPNIIAAGVPLTVYMMALRNDLDPLVQLVDQNGEVIVLDDGTRVECDDAGDESICFDNATSLDRSFIGRTPGGERDAMLSLPIQELNPETAPDLSLAYLMTSFERSSSGDYLIAFHIGIGSTEAGQGGHADNLPSDSNRDNVFVDYGIEVICPDGILISNGAEIITDFRPGETHQITALGIGTFDPLIAVVSPDGDIECVNNSANARVYAANLPTTGIVANSPASARLDITHTGPNSNQYSFIVGDANGGSGEFILLIEGATLNDENRADPYGLRLSPNIQDAARTPSIYMLATNDELDPYLEAVNSEARVVRVNGKLLDCDDAGDEALCFGETPLINNALISTEKSKIRGKETSSLLILPPAYVTSTEFAFIIASSYDQQSAGDYILAFHIDIAPLIRDSDSNI